MGMRLQIVRALQSPHERSSCKATPQQLLCLQPRARMDSPGSLWYKPNPPPNWLGVLGSSLRKK